MIEALKKRYQRSRLKDEDFAFLFDEPTDEEFVSFDCETTGLNVKKDEILSIGGVKIINNKIEFSESFERYVTPENHICEESIKIHHIRPCDMENSIEAKVAIEEFLKSVRRQGMSSVKPPGVSSGLEGLGGFLSSVWNAAKGAVTGAVKAFTGGGQQQPSVVVQQAPPPAPTGAGIEKYLPWFAVGGLALLVLMKK